MTTEPAGTPEPQPATPQPAAPPPLPPPAAEPGRSILETRPEILVGAAAVSGFVLARLLGRVRGG